MRRDVSSSRRWAAPRAASVGEAAVQEKERLRRHGGDFALAFDLRRARGNRRSCKSRAGDRAQHRQIDRAVGRVFHRAGARRASFPLPPIARDLNAVGPLEVELAADEQHGIADRPRVRAGAGFMRQKRSFAPSAFMRAGSDAALAIGAAEHDRADELLHRPAVLDEAHREMIEQFRVRRLLAGEAEVIHRAHQARGRRGAARRD